MRKLGLSLRSFSNGQECPGDPTEPRLRGQKIREFKSSTLGKLYESFWDNLDHQPSLNIYGPKMDIDEVDEFTQLKCGPFWDNSPYEPSSAWVSVAGYFGRDEIYTSLGDSSKSLAKSSQGDEKMIWHV